MVDWQSNHLNTGVLSVAPGQIMDPRIMKPRHRLDHLLRLDADVGLDLPESEPVPAGKPAWSFRQLMDQLGAFFYRQWPAST